MRYYDRQGQPLTLEEWASQVGDLSLKRVAQDDVMTPEGRCLWVSTVWLGLDMSAFGAMPRVRAC
jgi:hypothetical protein